MIILITNDDGIEAKGIRALVDAMVPCAEVYVSAPSRQMSGTSHGISLRRGMTVYPVEYPGAKEAWSVDGTPADCVKIGLHLLETKGIVPDYVFSGINHGSNLGSDTMYSGTVSAAIEGSMNEIRSMAFSVDSLEPRHFDTMTAFIPQLIRAAGDRQHYGTVLNVNVADIPMEDVKGVKATRLGPRRYGMEFEIKEPQEDGTFYSYDGKPLLPGDTDLSRDSVAVLEHYISITPLQYDHTDYNRLKDLENWNF